MRRNSAPGLRLALVLVLAVALVLSVAALAASPSKAKPTKPMKDKSAPTAESKEGKPKASVCHKARKTLSIGAPAVKAHLRHGDTLGRCA